MSNIYSDHLNLIRQQPALLNSLANLSRGIEKESLRINNDGTLSQSLHPQSLGSALCHSKITTDYSEALLEFITPVHGSIKGALAELNDIHHFTYHKLAQQDELLWTSSMPCQLGDEEDIPVAVYGSSNVATMKTVYRYGLGQRYGRQMQTVSGIHYNFSVSDNFWSHYQRALGNTDETADFKTQQYFSLIRNFRRYAPLFVYLFGSSPALCRSFLKGGQDHNLEKFDEHSWFGPYATSLRMGDLGYQSSEQDNLFVCYNCIDDYITSLKAAIKDSHPPYEKIGLFNAEGQQHQLNTSLLQIENEFYSTIRPKRVAASGEAPINALARGGVEYIEVRCVDINPFSPIGIDIETAKFLDLFLLYCLLSDSPKLNTIECSLTEENLKQVVEQGRKPNLKLKQVDGSNVNFKEWGLAILDDMQPLAELLDSLKANDDYQASLTQQSKKMSDPSLTPSAQVLQLMRDKKLTFAEFSRQQSLHWQQFFINKKMSTEKKERFEAYAADSMVQQTTIEAADDVDFSEYLAEFYSQY